MRWHMVQHGFATLHTHYYKEATCWQQALQGRDWVGYANIKLPQRLAEELQLLPSFVLPADGRLDPDPVSREVTDYLTFSTVFAEHCEQHVTPRLTGDDVVVVTYCTHRELFGAAMWLQRLPPQQRPRMVFIFHLPDLSWTIASDRSAITGNISAWRHAANQLAAQLPAERRLIGTTTPRLAACLTEVLGMPVHALTLVLPSVSEHNRPRPALRYDLALPGEFRWEKGSALCEQLLLELARWRPGLRFSVQVREEAEAHALQQRLQQQQFAGSLDLVFGPLTMAEYAERLCAARLALLAYLPQRYALRGSGVAFECFMYGIPLVAPGGTWIADQIEAGLGAGVLFHSWEVAPILQAVQQALLHIEALQQQARTLAPPWVARSGAQPMLRMICQHLGLD